MFLIQNLYIYICIYVYVDTLHVGEVKNIRNMFQMEDMLVCFDWWCLDGVLASRRTQIVTSRRVGRGVDLVGGSQVSTFFSYRTLGLQYITVYIYIYINEHLCIYQYTY